MKTKINKLLLNYRILNKLTQNEMAKLLACTQAQYSLWESGTITPIAIRENIIRRIINDL